jgi:hypothetical protein
MKTRTQASLALMLILSLASAPVWAQKRKQKMKPDSPAKPSLAVINNPAPVYASGEINIVVRGDENPIVRVQMVANGQTLVEFPAKDRIFKVNPADPDLVTIEDSPTKESDRFILLRSSRQFLPQAPGAQGSSAATSMLVQMTSGMVVTLLIYPVRDLDQVVHRCVVRYEREAIVSARQKAGLAVNLDRREETEKPKPAVASLYYAPVAKPMAADSSSVITQPATNASPPPIANSGKAEVASPAPIAAPPPSVRSTEIKTSKENNPPPGAWESVGNGKLNWSKTQHGLKAAAQTRAIDARKRLVAVSVRNTLDVPVKIAPNQPELCVQTLDDKGRVLQVEPVKPLKIETSRPDSLIAPDETARYLITYEAPILGAKQRLCIAVAQINAADEPVVIELTSGTR